MEVKKVIFIQDLQQIILATNFTNYRSTAEPILINGDFQIQQRRPDSSATGLTSESSSYIVPDRWCVDMTNIGTWSMGNGAAGPIYAIMLL